MEKVDTSIRGKSSVYIKTIIIPHYRKVIKQLEYEVWHLKKSRKNLLERKNQQIDEKRWLKHKSNQKRFAVQQKKVREKAVELTKEKVRKSAFEKADLLASVYYLPVYIKLAKENGLKLQEFVYIVYTSNFKYLKIDDYKAFFGESFNMTHFNACRTLQFIDSSKNITNSYFLSVKGRNLIKKVQEEVEIFKDE
jgi:hypothetical protein